MFRTETDSLGEKQLPNTKLFGIQTLRAQENFFLTGQLVDFLFIQKIVLVKKIAALANQNTGKLNPKKCNVIVQACNEILQGQHQEHFVTDQIQGGAGTSINMNVNEVLANRGLEILGHQRGEYQFLHPNDDLNASQSTNDVLPTALRLTALEFIQIISKEIEKTEEKLQAKANDWKDLPKLGRTHLQDAVPMRVGEELQAWVSLLSEDRRRLLALQPLLRQIPLGGTAIGNGQSATDEYRTATIQLFAEQADLQLRLTPDPIAATGNSTLFVQLASALKAQSINLIKISHDLRLLASGPAGGFGEFKLPELQPGSSIMPGKVNPVIPEAISQIGFRVIGADHSITLAAQGAQLQLNVMFPLLSSELITSLRLLSRAYPLLREKCLHGLKVNTEKTEYWLNQSTALSTKLSEYIGYEASSKLAKQTVQSGRSFQEVVQEANLLSLEQWQEIFGAR